MKLLITVAITLVITLSSTMATSGRLGSCKKCVKDGLESHLWSMNHIGTSTFCSANGWKDGGDGNPRLCDASAGVIRLGGQNDPFSPCGSLAWIGGEKNGLIAVGSAKTSQAFMIRDGENLNCGRDVKQSSNIVAVRHGRLRDIMRIYTRDKDGKYLEHIKNNRDGNNNEFQVGHRYVVRRTGRRGDLIWAYGVTDSGDIVEHYDPIRDGANYPLHILSETDFGVTFGRNHDLSARYCFNGSSWNVKKVRSRTMPSTC